MSTGVRISGALAILLAAFAPSLAAEALTGQWNVRSLGPAPWYSAAPPPAPLEGVTLVLAKDAIDGNRIVRCRNGRQEQHTLPVTYLFEGNLTTETMFAAARKLGLDKDGKGTPTIRFVCSNASFDLHLSGRNEFIFAIDNVIYRARRTD